MIMTSASPFRHLQAASYLLSPVPRPPNRTNSIFHEEMILHFSTESGPADLSKHEMANDSGSTMPSDKTPLLQDRLMRSLSGVDQHEQYGKEIL